MSLDTKLAKISFVDIGGQKSYHFSAPELINKSNVLLLVYEANKAFRLADLIEYYESLGIERNPPVIIPVATKLDLVNGYEDHLNDIKDYLAEKYGFVELNEHWNKEESIVFPTVLSSIIDERFKYNVYYVLSQLVQIAYKSKYNDTNFDKLFFYRIVLFGEGSVGKTSLINVLLEGKTEETRKTIGFDNSRILKIIDFINKFNHSNGIVDKSIDLDVDGKRVLIAVPLYLKS